MRLIKISNDDQLKELVLVMQDAARQVARAKALPPTKAKQPIAAFFEAIPVTNKALEVSPEWANCIEVEGLFVSLVLTLDLDVKEWVLSMSTITPGTMNEPGRVPDELATRLSTAFGTTHEMNSTKPAVFKNPRYFNGRAVTSEA